MKFDMNRRLAIRPALGLVMMISIMTTAGAGVLETLLMPGDVIEGHAKFETECNKCHEKFGQTNQNRFCVTCHKEVGKDIETKAGFHGRMKNIGTVECRSCHTEHKGRQADIVLLDKERFDHSATDFLLTGAHNSVACVNCHKPEQKYRDAKNQCVDCHKSNDPHEGRLGAKCASCHNETSWTKAKFDHEKTKFPLRGSHQTISCAACHPNDSYKKIPTDCISCHRINDIHNGRYGDKCETCHGVKKWAEISFDHNRHTKYPLEGLHAKVGCNSCHRGNLYKDKLQTTCISCHANDDRHKGRYGDTCQNCHAVTGWPKVTFDHGIKTRFGLKGKHQKVACDTCHQGNIYRDKLATECFACHQRDDKHNGQEGKRCERCHNESDWGGKIVFDHGLTRFPLIGQHAIAPCEECHLSSAFKGAPLECAVCHQADDVHKQTLGTSCAQCHNPNDWALWRFDHDTQTDYKLDGAHAGLTCKACHKVSVTKKIELATSCNSCHGAEDVHRGRFGTRCERCHTTKSFKDIKIN